MFDYGFDNFSYQTAILESEEIQEVPVELSEMDHVTVHPAQDTEVLMAQNPLSGGLGAEHGAAGGGGGAGSADKNWELSPSAMDGITYGHCGSVGQL